MEFIWSFNKWKLSKVSCLFSIILEILVCFNFLSIPCDLWYSLFLPTPSFSLFLFHPLAPFKFVPTSLDTSSCKNLNNMFSEAFLNVVILTFSSDKGRVLRSGPHHKRKDLYYSLYSSERNFNNLTPNKWLSFPFLYPLKAKAVSPVFNIVHPFTNTSCSEI